MRLFTAVDLPGEVIGNIGKLLEHLRPEAHIRWSPIENLHVTTQFIGHWPDERIEGLKAALAAIPERAPISVSIHELGFFPNPRSPRVFWCGVDALGLAPLARDTDRAMEALGIEPEQRAFSPHLTLARIKEKLNLQPLRDAIAALPSLEFGRFAVSSFFLYESKVGRTGSVYTKLAEFPFAK